ncbi:hypothetical protein RvY_12346-3 [Ramazzottius varieornatus]|uniref:Uncharacterized protein n=1 Tax=Ramazzottius varieornatus TaxID=947166 RepID=A0A1D1VJ93_RAMVA|nr:hypothetical protein RvY_12346-3 [Ramazzottius varieornatus]
MGDRGGRRREARDHRNDVRMKRSSEWMDDYGSLISRTANLPPPSKKVLSDTGRVHSRFRFSFERPAVDKRTLRCNTGVGRKRPIDAVSAPETLCILWQSGSNTIP